MAHLDPFQRLKELAEAQKSAPGRVVAVASGKGGVGKSNVALNLAIALAEAGQRVVLFDADTRLSNIDLLLGVEPRHSVMDVVLGRKTLTDIMQRHGSGFNWISVGAVQQDFESWEDTVREGFFKAIFELRFQYDYVFIDTSAGLTQSMVDFALGADEVLLVTTPEPTAMSDAYALMKILRDRQDNIEVRTVINQTLTDEEGQEVFERFALVCDRFLGKAPALAGCVPDDTALKAAVRRQQPLLSVNAESPAAQAIRKLAEDLYL